MRWIIGDIHGMLAALESLLRAIDRVDPDRQLMFVGDYVNRGPDSKRVIDLLISLPGTQAIRGNHDDVFDNVISAQCYYATKPGEEHRIASFKWFLQHGLDKTPLSYGIKPAEIARVVQKPSDAALNQLVEPIPAAHRKFIRDLPVLIETPDMFVAHANWDIYTATQTPPMQEQLRRRVGSQCSAQHSLWGRYQLHEVDSDKAWERTGYFGHTPVDVCIVAASELLPAIWPEDRPAGHRRRIGGERPSNRSLSRNRHVSPVRSEGQDGGQRVAGDCWQKLTPMGHRCTPSIALQSRCSSVPIGGEKASMNYRNHHVLDLPPHHLKIALIRPQIAPNTCSNIARLCVATGTELHLRPATQRIRP